MMYLPSQQRQYRIQNQKAPTCANVCREFLMKHMPEQWERKSLPAIFHKKTPSGTNSYGNRVARKCDFRNPSTYSNPKLKQILAGQYKNEKASPKCAEDPAVDAMETYVVQAIVPEDSAVVDAMETIVVQDMHSKEELCKATPTIRGKKAKNRTQNYVDSKRSTYR